MAIRAITIYGEPVLHQVAAPVTDINHDVRDLVRDMFETMDAAPGVGIAAPQVGIGLRIFTYNWEEEDGTLRRGVAINPELWQQPSVPESFEELTEDEEEGCLSFPGERFALRRSPAVLMRAMDLDGQTYEVEASGWFARILQHEFDHLNGVIYVDRLQLPLYKQAMRVMRKQHWNVPGKSWTPGIDDIDA